MRYQNHSTHSLRGATPLFLILVGLACATSPPGVGPVTATSANMHVGSSSSRDPLLRAEVEALNKAMMTAFDFDPSTVSRFYADSGRIVGPGREVVVGRAAIERYWAGIRRPAKWALELLDVGGSREEAYQIGVSRLTSTRSDGRLGTYVCDFVVIWKRGADGSLRIVLDLYN